MPIIMGVTGEASIIKLPRRWPICGIKVVGSTSIKNRDNSNCLFPHVRFLPKVHGDRVIYGKLAELGWLHSTWNRATLKAFGGSNPSLSAIYHNQVWRKPSSICWVYFEVSSANSTLRKFTQCWQRGQFAKLIGLRKKASRVGTCNFRQQCYTDGCCITGLQA